MSLLLVSSSTVLEKRECDVVVAAPSKGINAQTGDGLEEAMKGAEVLVDVSNITKWDSEGESGAAQHLGKDATAQLAC